MFLGLMDPLFRGMDPDPSTSISKNSKKPLIPTVLCLLFHVLSLKNYVNVLSKSTRQKNFFVQLLVLFCWRLGCSMTKIGGTGSESISERHGSDPHQNVMDPLGTQQKCNVFFV
jgi:hypothetical protein